MTAAERLAEAEHRLEDLEADCERLRDIACHLVATVELLAEAAGANLPTGQPARPALRLIQGGEAR